MERAQKIQGTHKLTHDTIAPPGGQGYRQVAAAPSLVHVSVICAGVFKERTISVKSSGTAKSPLTYGTTIPGEFYTAIAPEVLHAEVNGPAIKTLNASKTMRAHSAARRHASSALGTGSLAR